MPYNFLQSIMPMNTLAQPTTKSTNFLGMPSAAQNTGMFQGYTGPDFNYYSLDQGNNFLASNQAAPQIPSPPSIGGMPDTMRFANTSNYAAPNFSYPSFDQGNDFLGGNKPTPQTDFFGNITGTDVMNFGFGAAKTALGAYMQNKQIGLAEDNLALNRDKFNDVKQERQLIRDSISEARRKQAMGG